MPTLHSALYRHVRPQPHPAVVRALLALAAPVSPAQMSSRRARRHGRRLSLAERYTWHPPPVRRRVIVIGAGLAGLAAAHELQSVGYEVVVVDAQDRIGGRVDSRSNIVRGRTVEAGGELIGTNHYAWLSYKRKFGLGFRVVPDPPKPPVCFGGKLLTPTEARRLFRAMSKAIRLVNDAARDVDADRPWLSRDAKALDRLPLSRAVEALDVPDEGKLAVIEQLEADNGQPAERQSYLGNLAMIRGHGLRRFWTDTERYRCKGGNLSLATALATWDPAPRIMTGAPVDTIVIERSRCVVGLANGDTLAGHDVVLAVPPRLWEGMCISPPLTKRLDVQVGKNVKYLLPVRKGSWHPAAATLTSDGPIDLTWEGTAEQRGPDAALVAFSGGDDAETCAGWSDRPRRYLEELGRVYPRIHESARDGVFMNWPCERWALGSYSFPAPGEVMRVGPLLRDGVKGRLHFAGEHTSYAFVGYMEGALQSGLRVATTIARRDGVIR